MEQTQGHSQHLAVADQLFKDPFLEPHLNIHSSPLNSDILFNIRLISLIYLSAIFIWQLTFTRSIWVSVMGMMEWGYLFTLLYFILTTQHYILRKYGFLESEEKDNLRYYVELIYEFSFSVQLPITAIFWGYIFHYLSLALDLNQILKQILFPYVMEYITWDIIILNLNLHLAPIIFLLIELPYNPFSFTSKHFLLISGLSVLYLIINVAYSILVRPAYLPMDWVSFQSYGVCLIAIMLTYLMHSFGGLIYRVYKRQKMENEMGANLIQQKAIEVVAIHHEKQDSQKQ